MKLKRCVALLLISTLLVFGGPTILYARQTAVPPIVVFAANDLWTASESGGLTPLTRDAYVQGAALSPDGMRLAYAVWAPISVEALKSGQMRSGYSPTDVWVIDIASGQGTAIATQPANASYDVPENAIVRSTPTWSPDGQKIAWTEMPYPDAEGPANRLIVYDLASGQGSAIVSGLPVVAGVPGPLDVKWGEGGLAVLNFLMNPTDGSSSAHILAYDTSGTRLSDTTLPDDAQHTYDFFVWVTQAGRSYIGVHYYADLWDLIDPQTGQRQPATTAPELVSPTTPASSLMLTFTHDQQADPFSGYQWAVTSPNGQAITVPGLQTSPPAVALSPDGQAIAFIDQNGGLAIWRNGQVQPVAGTDSLDQYSTVFWGPSAWRVGQSAIAAPLAQTTMPLSVECPGAPPARLIVGAQGQLQADTTPNNLRDNPGKEQGKVIGQIVPGGIFTVLAGPQCADGMLWWQVNYNGTVGWTAEGDSSGYWLEPLGG